MKPLLTNPEGIFSSHLEFYIQIGNEDKWYKLIWIKIKIWPLKFAYKWAFALLFSSQRMHLIILIEYACIA